MVNKHKSASARCLQYRGVCAFPEESNVEDRSLIYAFPFLFGVASLHINVWSIRIHMYARQYMCALRYVFANNYCVDVQ